MGVGLSGCEVGYIYVVPSFKNEETVNSLFYTFYGMALNLLQDEFYRNNISLCKLFSFFFVRGLGGAGLGGDRSDRVCSLIIQKFSSSL
jgi:hypothetical protein